MELQRRVSAQVIFAANQQVRYSWACAVDFRHPLNNINIHELQVKAARENLVSSLRLVLVKVLSPNVSNPKAKNAEQL